MDWEGIRGVLMESDYLVLPSYTEGLPFVILEAMNMGIPCIYSDINGARELLGKRGFLFRLRGYEECRYRMDWGVYEKVDRYREENMKNLEDCIIGAYGRGIVEWNRMSRDGGDYVRRNYMEGIVMRRNMSLLGVK